MRKSIVDSVITTVRDLNKSGLVDDIAMKNMEQLCLPEIQKYSPEKEQLINNKLKFEQK
ncbi:MAG: hypothetical protein WGN25_04960 [Candidatus Electrothrix sp. GW3-4]|uniref:hypothetical protein n=1 Tax=Candidatus Electrothrix sp. GW3-4 TaxID=3126740 RepID=UPI0030CAD683